MTHATQTDEQLIGWISAMDRSHLIEALNGFHCAFPLDFTEEYLNELTEDRLRHLVLAVAMRASGEAEAAPPDAPPS